MKPKTGHDAATGSRSGRSHSIAQRVTRMLLLDAEFHDLVAAACHQPRLIQVWDLVRGQFMLLIAGNQRRLGLATAEVHRTPLVHHAERAALIRARDTGGAERCARDVLEAMLVVPETRQDRGET